MKVLVAMSGGVDSSVAAALALDAGHDVTGVHLKLAHRDPVSAAPGQGCCTLDDAQDARRVAQVLDIPFYVWDLSDRFQREVQDPFAADYAAGRTPNPCVRCNERVKYAGLLDRARALGFDALATGHHARIRTDGHTRLLRATDRAKDQSYVLYSATADQLAHTLLPVGELTKADVRAEAELRGLRVATKPDSYEVCFVPEGTRAYLADRLPVRQGPIVDVDGRVHGTHEGVWSVTVGQRRGLALAGHERRFVVDVDASTDTVVVGPREALASRWVRLDRVSWIGGRPPQGDVRVQVRAHGRTVLGHVDGDRLVFDQPHEGVACGQAAVVYSADDRECLGGGTVIAAERPVRVAVPTS